MAFLRCIRVLKWKNFARLGQYRTLVRYITLSTHSRTMPGIPRSKSCVNCKERKVKCDLSRPTCKRCIESGRACKGYRKLPTQFVNCSSAPPPHNDSASPSKHPGAVKQPSVGPVLIDHLLALFLQNYLPTAHNKITHNHQYGLSWAQYMPSICNKSPMLMQSLAAVSLAIVGRSSHDERLIKRSFEVYGAALRGLRGVLRRREGKHTQDTLASMMAMTTYEMWQPTFKSGHGWMAHVQGASRIMQSLGPVSTHTPLDASLLSHFRTSSIFDALGRRKPYLWSRDNWGPRRTSPPKLNEVLLDIIADIPALFEETDSLLDSERQEPQFTLKRIAVMRKYTMFHEQLQGWYSGVEQATPAPIYWKTTKDDPVEIEGFPFETQLAFSSLPVAQLVLIHWTLRSMLYSEMDRLTSTYEACFPSQPLRSSVSKPTAENAPNTFVTSSLAFADLAMQAEPFCTHISHGMSGVQSVAFSMWALQHHVYLGRCPEKERYCDRRALELGRSRGLYFLSQVTNLSCDDYKQMGKMGLRLEIVDGQGVPGDEEISYFDRSSLERFDYGGLSIPSH